MADYLTVRDSFQLAKDYIFGPKKVKEIDEHGNEVTHKAYRSGVDSMMTMWDLPKGIWDSTIGKVGNYLKDVPKGLASWMAGFGTNIDDNVDIPTYTRTLTDHDFSELYASPVVKEQKVSDGSSIYIYDNASNSYNTEMICNFKADSDVADSNLRSSKDHIAYDSLSPEQKVTYEATLLSKKYSAALAMCDESEINSVSEEYTNRMNEYKEYCGKNGINWQTTLHKVSEELQYEIYSYNHEANTRLFQDRSEKTREVAVNAHILTVNYAEQQFGKGFDDQVPYPLANSKEWQDSIDENGQFKFYNKLGVTNIATRIESRLDGVKNAFSSAGEKFTQAKDELNFEADSLIFGFDNSISKMKTGKELTIETYENADGSVDFDY